MRPLWVQSSQLPLRRGHGGGRREEWGIWVETRRFMHQSREGASSLRCSKENAAATEKAKALLL